MRLLLDVSTWLYRVHESLLVENVFFSYPCPLLHCLSTSSVVFLALFFQLIEQCNTCPNQVSLHSTFYQPLSFLAVEYFALSPFSSCHVLLFATIFLAVSFLLWEFFTRLLFLSNNIPNHTIILELTFVVWNSICPLQFAEFIHHYRC